jgi:hypothetical protein
MSMAPTRLAEALSRPRRMGFDMENMIKTWRWIWGAVLGCGCVEKGCCTVKVVTWE